MATHKYIFVKYFSCIRVLSSHFCIHLLRLIVFALRHMQIMFIQWASETDPVSSPHNRKLLNVHQSVVSLLLSWCEGEQDIYFYVLMWMWTRLFLTAITILYSLVFRLSYVSPAVGPVLSSLFWPKHPPIHSPSCLSYVGSCGCGSCPSVLGQKQGNTLDRWPGHHRANTDIHTFTLTPTGNFSFSAWPAFCPYGGNCTVRWQY